MSLTPRAFLSCRCSIHDGDQEGGTNGDSRPQLGENFSDVVTPATRRDNAKISVDPSLLANENGTKAANTDDSFPQNNNLVTPSATAETQTSTISSNTPSTLSKEDIQSLMWKEAAYNASANDGTVVKKRNDYISWDEYFMAVASLSSHRSKDPHEPTGACLVDGSNRIIGIGYNGFPQHCSDDCLPWNEPRASEKQGEESPAPIPWLHTQSPFVVPAEINAILNKCSADVQGASLYTRYFPNNECTKVIIQSGVRQVVYMDYLAGEVDSDSTKASRIMLTMAGVKVRRYQPSKSQLVLNFGVSPTTSQDNNKRKMNEPEEQQAGEEVSSVKRKLDDSGKTCEAISTAPLVPEDDAIKFRDLLMREANYDPVAMGPAKRQAGVLSWDDYFMAMAFLTAQRSKDPNTQVGACIVDKRRRIVGLGYNGLPAFCSDDDLPWARKASSPLQTKYPYVCHAEVNAILNKGSAGLQGTSLYVALFPCNECAKMIIQAGIKEVIYLMDTYHDTESCRASRILFTMARVKMRKHLPAVSSIRLILRGNP